MRRTYERGTKARLNLSVGPHTPVNMVDSVEEMNGSGEKRRKWHSRKRLLRCTALYFIRQVFSLRDFHRLFGSRNSPTTDMFTGACGPPEKLSLALVPRSNVVRMILKLAFLVFSRITFAPLRLVSDSSKARQEAWLPRTTTSTRACVTCTRRSIISRL